MKFVYVHILVTQVEENTVQNPKYFMKMSRVFKVDTALEFTGTGCN